MSDLRYPTASPAMVKDIMEEVLFLSLEDFNDIVEVIAGKDEEELRPQFASKVLALQRLYAVTVDRDAAVVTAEKLDEYRLLWDRLLECYFLADFLGAPAFGNAAMNALIEAIDSEREYRAKLEPDVEVFAPILGVDDPEDNQNHFDNVENHNENEENDDQHIEDQWENLYRDPFEENRPRRDIRRMLGTLPYRIQRVYSETKTCSPILKMLMDKIIKQGIDHYPHYEKLCGLLEAGMPVEFHHDLVDELMRSLVITHQMSQGVDHGRHSADNRARRRCLYHIHSVGERCPGLGYNDPNPEW